MPDGHNPSPATNQDQPLGIAGLDAATIRALWKEGLESGEPIPAEVVFGELQKKFGLDDA